MYQQINLYQPVFRQQRKIFSATTMLQVIGLAAITLLAFYAQATWTLHGLQATESTLSEHYSKLEVRLGVLENIRAPGEDLTVEEEVARLQQAIETRQALLDSLDEHGEGQGRFGDFFELLANHTLPGLWLTAIRIDETGETELRGTTHDPELVPRYLQIFPAGTRIATLHRGSVHLTRTRADDRAVQFIVSSVAGETL